MKKVISVLIMLTLCSVILVGCGNKETTPTPKQSNPQGSEQQQKQPETSNTVLKVALDACYPPMEFEQDGEIVGFSADLITALAKEMNRSVELINTGWDEIFDSLYAKKFNVIISSVTINDERKATMLFSDSYYTSSPIILTSTSKNITSAKDLTSKTVSVQDGTTAHEIISNNIAGVNLVTFGTGDEALEAFSAGRVDAVVMDSPVIRDYAKKQNNAEYVVVEDSVAFPKEEFGIVANKDDTNLITEINAALDKLKANGEYDKIYNKYFM